MSDELDPTPNEHDTQPLAVTPASAVASFMEWLQSRQERTGPFSAHYNAEAGNALVKRFCDAQGWTLDEAQVQQVEALRGKYPE
jgi:hypothetical protein